MAGSRTAAARRRQQQAVEARRERVLMIAIVVVLTAAAVIVAVGLYFSVYLPPRSHVASIGEVDYDAAAVARRASYYMVFEGGAQTRAVDTVPEYTLELLARETVLREHAPALVGEVTEDDVDNYVRERLGNPDPGEAYGKLLGTTLKSAGLSRDEYFSLARAQLLSDRLREHFKADVPTTAEQRHLARVRLSTEAAAKQLRARSAAGEDFEKISRELGIENGFGDVGWLPLDLLGDEQAAAIASVAPGATSEPLPAGPYFDVWKVLELEPSRELTGSQRDSLAQARVDDWIEEQRAGVVVERNLSASEAQWIRQQVTDKIVAAFRNPA